MKRSIQATIMAVAFFAGVTTIVNAAEQIQPIDFDQQAPAMAAPTEGNAPAVPGEEQSNKGGAADAIPLRFTFIPETYYWPQGHDVYGINIGLPIGFTQTENVYGIDFALISSMTDRVKGIQSSLVTKGYMGQGVEISLINLAEKFAGLQAAVLNSMQGSDAVQVGLLNIGTGSNGLQIGLINVMDNGFLPIFPFINFSM